MTGSQRIRSRCRRVASRSVCSSRCGGSDAIVGVAEQRHGRFLSKPDGKACQAIGVAVPVPGNPAEPDVVEPAYPFPQCRDKFGKMGHECFVSAADPVDHRLAIAENRQAGHAGERRGIQQQQEGKQFRFVVAAGVFGGIGDFASRAVRGDRTPARFSRIRCGGAVKPGMPAITGRGVSSCVRHRWSRAVSDGRRSGEPQAYANLLDHSRNCDDAAGSSPLAARIPVILKVPPVHGNPCLAGHSPR